MRLCASHLTGNCYCCCYWIVKTGSSHRSLNTNSGSFLVIAPSWALEIRRMTFLQAGALGAWAAFCAGLFQDWNMSSSVLITHYWGHELNSETHILFTFLVKWAYHLWLLTHMSEINHTGHAKQSSVSMFFTYQNYLCAVQKPAVVSKCPRVFNIWIFFAALSWCSKYWLKCHMLLRVQNRISLLQVLPNYTDNI